MTKHPITLRALAEGVSQTHAHVPVAVVNDHQVILAVNEAPYPWHVHEDSDELFIVLEGSLRIDFADGSGVDLQPMDAYLVPAGTTHKTTPCGRCVNLVFEAEGAETVFHPAGWHP